SKDIGGYDARVISPAGIGGKVAPNAVQILFVAGVIGLLSGIGLAYLSDVSDKSFRTPEEVRRRLGPPVVGHIPFVARDEKVTAAAANGTGRQLAPSLFAYHRTTSVEAEAYRSLRTALYFSTQGEKHKVIQITSPNMADGKTTLASNLAISI